jgi:hypothetical protein
LYASTAYTERWIEIVAWIGYSETGCVDDETRLLAKTAQQLYATDITIGVDVDTPLSTDTIYAASSLVDSGDVIEEAGPQ